MAWQVSASQQGVRADQFVREHAQLSRVDVAALFAQGQVRVNGRRVPKGQRLAAGDNVALDPEASLDAAAQPDPSVVLQLVHEDAQLVVVEKPAGMACHPLRAGELGCLANGLLARYPELGGIGYEARQPGLVNRIDNDTSGLVLVARTAAAFASLRGALAAGEIQKRYIAACAVEPGQRVVEVPLAPDPQDPRRVCARGERESLEANWQPARSELLEIRPWLGVYRIEVEAHRALRHQVRAHLALLRAPILGDTLYGGPALPCGHHLLHASHMALRHPVSGRPLRFQSEPPEAWAAQITAGCTGLPGP